MIDIKELLSALKLSSVDADKATVQEIVSELNKLLIPRADVMTDPDFIKHFDGKVFGRQNSLLSKFSNGKSTKEELAKMGWEDGFNLVFGGLNVQIEEQKKKNQEGADKQVVDLQKQLDELSKSVQDEKRDKDSALFELQKEKLNSSEKLKAIDIKQARRDKESSIKWKKDMTKVERIGFENALNELYDLDLDDTKKELVVKTKDGHTVPNPKVVGTSKTYLDVVLEIAEENNLIEKSDGPEGYKKKIGSFKAEDQKQQDGKAPMRRLPTAGS